MIDSSARRPDPARTLPLPPSLDLPAVMDSLSDAIVVVDRARRVVAANRRYLEVFGAGREHVVGLLCDDAVACPEAAAGQLGRCPACRARDLRTPQREIRVLPDAGGGTRRWEITFNPILDANEVTTHVVEVWRDISERTALEAQLSHSERLASIGMLAAGVGHEINNPLASLMASVESLERLLKRGMSTDADRAEALEIVQLAEREVTRCRETTDKLVLLAQPYSVAPIWVDFNRAVLDTASLLRHQMNKQGIEWRAELEVGLPRVWARESGIRGVCLNLMMNAVQAMPTGGVLRVSTRLDGRTAEMRVEDTGPGIPPEHLQRIWDPFFTTKPAGQGTGLGLFVTQSIVHRNGGTIRVENVPGRGARFTLRLPLDSTEGNTT
ncbi:MAG TPA: ATP-binding protein [Candidatus Sulfotelmatobacter sp.]|nr:ATP-binding protein [Candidatus Sulfotelmatobacter sp.]